MLMELLKDRSGIEGKFFELCRSITNDNGYELYDLEYQSGSKLLRLYIMDRKTQSALIEDCVKIDHALTPYFESETWMPDEVTLEVSSPGIYRTLRTFEHFQMVVGKTIATVLNKNLSGDKYKEMPKSITAEKKLKGKLLNVNENGLFLNIGKFDVEIPFENLKKANLEEDLDFKK
jgi:ribosome maturation factor RimP